MPKVLPPDIRETDPHPGMPALRGPENLVNELHVVPFDEFDEPLAKL